MISKSGLELLSWERQNANSSSKAATMELIPGGRPENARDEANVIGETKR